MSKESKNDSRTWDDIRASEVGTILRDVFEEGLRFIVMRGPASLCGYVGVPNDHPLAGHSYEDLPLEAHGGLTFSHKGEGKWPEGYYWYGWDYAHSGDYCFYYDEHSDIFRAKKDKKWLVDEVVEDSWSTLYDFKKLMRLAEHIRKEVDIG